MNLNRFTNLLELLEDGGDSGTERNGVVAEANDVTSGAWDAEECGGALLLERGGDFLGDHLELHLQVDEVFVQ